MSKRVKISLISSIILFVVMLALSYFVPFFKITNRIIDTILAIFISCLIYYVFTYFLIKGFERRDEERMKK